MKPLTLEQVAEGRRVEAAYDKYRGADQTDALFGWLLDHTEALLDAAERVARQEAYAAAPDGYDTPEREP